MLTTAFASLLLMTAANPALDALVENALQVDTGEITYVVTFNEDGSYTTSMGTGGTWTYDDGEFCVTNQAGQTNCQPLMEGASLGDSWEGQNAAGEPVTLTLVARE